MESLRQRIVLAIHTIRLQEVCGIKVNERGRSKVTETDLECYREEEGVHEEEEQHPPHLY